jgi:uncharacterized protein DUF1538
MAFEVNQIKSKIVDTYTILAPYVGRLALEQIKACLPIVLYLVFFLLVIFRGQMSNPILFIPGIIFVLLGLMFFMEGLRLGLMPFAETLGNTLPKKATIYILLGFTFLVGIGATLAEPAIGVLKSVGSSVDHLRAPVLYDYLQNHTQTLVIMVAIGVGVATILGVLRFLHNWSLKTLIFPLLSVVLALTAFAHFIPNLRSIIGLAWDCGGVTTGPVTVPLVLALGMGVSRARGSADTGMSGFGVVTLASLFPILFVLLSGIILYYSGEINLSVTKVVSAEAGAGIFTVFVDAITYAARAIIPLMLFLYLVQRFILKEVIPNGQEILVGVVFCLIGMAIFNLGLAFGLVPLGEKVGEAAPSAFAMPKELYGPVWGRVIVIMFAFFLGYGATMAEPALNALGLTVENVTQGAFKKKLLINSVAFGVGCGIALGVTKMMFDIPLAYLLIPLYVLLMPITYLASEKFVNIGWDSAGVTTGPITVPLVLAMGLGVGSATSALDGFGIISLASVCPIIVVLTLGILIEGPARKAS